MQPITPPQWNNHDVTALTRDYQELLAGLAGPRRLKEADTAAVIVATGTLKWAVKGVAFEKRLCSISSRNTIETDQNVQEVNEGVIGSLKEQGFLQEHQCANGDPTSYVILTAEAEKRMMALEADEPDLLPEELSPDPTPTP